VDLRGFKPCNEDNTEKQAMMISGGNRFMALVAAAVNAPAVTLTMLLVVDFCSCFSSYGKADVHWLDLWLPLYSACPVLTKK